MKIDLGLKTIKNDEEEIVEQGRLQEKGWTAGYKSAQQSKRTGCFKNNRGKMGET